MVKFHRYLKYFLLCSIIGKYNASNSPCKALMLNTYRNSQHSKEFWENRYWEMRKKANYRPEEIGAGPFKEVAHSMEFPKDAKENDRTELIINEKISLKYLIAYTSTGFINLVSQGHLTIDKTLLIRHIAKINDESFLILCPRKWGKTTNLRMLESYFQIQDDVMGNPIPLEKTSNYKFFQEGILPGGGKLKKPPLIAGDEKLKEEFLGKWPVVFVDLNTIKPTNIKEFRVMLISVIRSTYEEFENLRAHWYCRMTGNYTHEKRRFYSKRLEDFDRYYKLPQGDWTDTLIQTALPYLTRLLFQHYGKQVILLMDEYDTPFNIALTSPDFKEEDRVEACTLYRTLCMLLLRGNRFIYKSVIVGILKLAKKELFSDWNTLREYNFLNNELFFYFGINQIELEDIYNYLHLPHDERFQVSRWYDGYRAGGEAHRLRIANPTSIQNYFRYRKFKCYWEGNTGTVGHLLVKLFHIKPFMLEMNFLMRGGSVVVNTEATSSHDVSFSQADLQLMNEYISNNSENHYLGTRLIMKLLLVAGYLTYSDDQDHFQKDVLHSLFPQENGVYVRIPNIEIYYAFGKIYGTFLNSYEKPVRSYEYYKELSKKFRSFVVSNETTSLGLENQFSLFFSVLPHLVLKEDLNKSTNYTHDLICNEFLINSIIIWIGVCDQNYFNFTAGQVSFKLQEDTSIPDGIFTVGSRGIICELKFGDEFSLLEEARKQIKDKAYPALFKQYNQRFKNIEDVKLIAIQVCQNTTTRIHAEIIPSRLAESGGYTRLFTKASKPRTTFRCTHPECTYTARNSWDNDRHNNDVHLKNFIPCSYKNCEFSYSPYRKERLNKHLREKHANTLPIKR